jgi:hypothetical protein
MSPRLGTISPLLLALTGFAPLASCHGPSGPAWTPGTVYATPRALNARGFLDRRGLIHSHSIYSHDACDNKPVLADGARDPVCFEDFRRGVCQSKHDFVMLTDHNTSFSAIPYPDNLLFRAERGDVLVTRNGGPVANWAACSDGQAALILPGIEAGIMPVGLERHVSDDVDARSMVYGADTPDAIEQLKQNGAVALVAHTENWTAEQLIDLPLDGFEMYNLHANTIIGAGGALELVLRIDRGDTALPYPDASLVNWVSEDPRYLKTWGTVLASGAKRVTTMGTDCHRNTFPMLASDGERLDSYRRLMIWFSNHLLVRPESDGTWDDRHLKEALKQGRLYGAFEVFGYPLGFDYRAEVKSEVHEMGEEVSLADGAELLVALPRIENLDPAKPAPKITLRILRAIEDGWDEVAKSEAPIRFRPTKAGAYRAEVRIVPNHLKGKLGDYEHTVLGEDFVWIYANAIYVR